MEAYLTKKEILINEEESKKEVMKGDRNRTNRMWYLSINNSNTSSNTINNNQLINSVYKLKKQKDIIDYLSQEM